jgi:hypothetical protein
VSDLDWQVILTSGHWDCGGWSRDGRDGLLICACGTRLSEPERAAAS